MERTQVERHMRMCIHATEGFRTMVTLSPSEPLLAEASATIMKTDLGEKEAPSALLDHIMGSYVSTGERGELVAALILLLARDKATQEIPQYGGGLPEGESPFKNDGMTTRRVITVLQFLEALVPSEITVLSRDGSLIPVPRTTRRQQTSQPPSAKHTSILTTSLKCTTLK